MGLGIRGGQINRVLSRSKTFSETFVGWQKTNCSGKMGAALPWILGADIVELCYEGLIAALTIRDQMIITGGVIDAGNIFTSASGVLPL